MRTLPASLLLLVLLPACDREPALLRQGRKAEAVGALSRAFLQSVEAEKSAVLATTDEESVRFADESRRAAARVEQVLPVLRALVAVDSREVEAQRLEAFATAWAAVAAIDARLLPLAVANTNLQAAHLSTHQAAEALGTLVSLLQARAAEERDPDRLRVLARAEVAALTIQTLHPPHIASPSDPEMADLEARITGLAQVVDGVLAAPPEGRWRTDALRAWREYQALTAEVLRLSRENTNVRSFALSVHEKREASTACDAALQALAAEVVAPGPWPTR